MTCGVWVQIAGLVLQVVGVVVVLLGVLRTREHLGKRPVRHTILSPFRRLWRKLFPPPPVKIEGRAAMAALAASAVGRVTAKPNWSKLSVDESIKRLQAKVDEHEDELVRMAGRVDQETRERQEADTRQDTERERLRVELQQRIEQAAAVGLGREFAGTLLVLVGLVVIGIGIML